MDKPIMVMLVGLPSSGKSTYAKQLSKEIDAEIFSSDALREELYGDISNQEHNGELFVELHRRIKNCLRFGKSAIYDACNISSKRRKSFLQELNKIDCVKRCIIMATPYEKCLENNRNRDRQVPENVIERMYKHWETPYWFEGWNSINIYYYDKNKKDINDWVSEHMDYSQDNPHHTLTLGEHCKAAASQSTKLFIPTCNNKFDVLADDYYKSIVAFAAMIHDCGKPFTKKFENSKGESTDIAHFYSHENVGAYDSLFFEYIFDESALDVSILVNLHMSPYYWERTHSDKLRNKYKKLWGDKLFDLVMILHKADKAAH